MLKMVSPFSISNSFSHEIVLIKLSSGPPPSLRAFHRYVTEQGCPGVASFADRESDSSILYSTKARLLTLSTRTSRTSLVHDLYHHVTLLVADIVMSSQSFVRTGCRLVEVEFDGIVTDSRIRLDGLP